MIFFTVSWVITLVGWIIHVLVDGVPNRRTKHRVLELLLLWMLVVTGVFGVISGFLHASSLSSELAELIGYAPSMFQWEVGWGDIALGVLLIGCAFPKLRDGWMTASVVVLTFQYGGDAIGHIMGYEIHDNFSPDNVWAIPSDILQPLVAITLLVLYRRGQRELESNSS